MKNTLRFAAAFVFAACASHPPHGAIGGAPPSAAVLAGQETAATFQGAAAEEFLQKAKVVTARELGTGITRPLRVTLQLNGVTHDGIFKDIDESKPGATSMAGGKIDVAYQDSWQCEIAAYVVDRIIGLGLVPATIQKDVRSRRGSLQWFVESKMTEAKRVADKISPPDAEAWNQQMLKVRLFDQLIANVDRHLNNLLVTENFEVRLVDHSRSFRINRELLNPEDLTRFSRSLLDGIKQLNKPDLKKKVKSYLSDPQIERLLQRRDAILALADKLVKERGEAAVIYP